MKTAHTSGPWNIIHRTQTDGTNWIQGATKDENGWREVCAMPSWPSRNRELEAANARLIAAAPDLLAALQSLVWSLNESNTDCLGLAGAIRAIARAEGRTP